MGKLLRGGKEGRVTEWVRELGTQLWTQ